MKPNIKVIVSVVAACLFLGCCTTIIRPPRPMFAWRYGYHPDRPTIPIWWFDSPMVDHNGAEAIVDTRLNLIVVCVPSPIVASLPWGQGRYDVVDSSGRLIVKTGTLQDGTKILRGDRLSDTPIVKGQRDRMFLRAVDGTWHDRTIPPALADSLRQTFYYGPKVLDELRDVVLTVGESDREFTEWVQTVWPEMD